MTRRRGRQAPVSPRSASSRPVWARSVSPRPLRGQRGVTLLEVLIAVAIIGLVGVPVTAWAVSTLRQQDLAQNLIRNAIATGNLGRELSTDVATARQIFVDSGGDCVGGAGSGGTVRLALITGGLVPAKVVYSEAPGTATGATSLWRRQCAPDGTLQEANELFKRIVPGTVRTACAPPQGGSAPAPGEACPVENRRVRLEVTPARPDHQRPVEVHATRRTSAGTRPGGGSTNSPPIAIAHVSPLVGYSNTVFQFSATGSWDPDGDTLSFSWEFPDGSTASGATASRSFGGGEHLVLLRADDGRGGVHSTPVTVRVINQHPIADLQITPEAGAPGDVFTLSAAGSVDPDGGGLSYHWDLGDGRTQTGPAVITASYSADIGPAVQVTVTVTDGQGASDTTSRTISLAADPGEITISPPPVAKGFQPPRVGTVGKDLPPLEVTFSAEVDQPGTRWVLARADGEQVATGEGDELRHTFRDGDHGEYTIARQWVDSGSPFGQPVAFRVNAAPTAAFDYTAAGPGGVTELRGGGVDPDGTIVSYRWYGLSTYWGGNLASPDSTNPNPSQVFPNPGTYDVTLMVTDDDGAFATVTRQVRIPGSPSAPPPPGWQGGQVRWSPIPGAEEYRVTLYCNNTPSGDVIDVPKGPSPSATVPSGFCGGGVPSAMLMVRANGIWSPGSEWGTP